MRKTYKYRIYLTHGQRRILNTMLEECRFVYNQTLEAREFAYEHSITCGLYDTQAMLPQWKQTRLSLKLVHSQVLQNVQVRVDLAVQAFFRRVKAGEKEVGYPRFKAQVATTRSPTRSMAMAPRFVRTIWSSRKSGACRSFGIVL